MTARANPPASPAPDAAEFSADPGETRAVFPGAGEMAARCRAVDWAATPLGPADRWPAALRTAVRLMLAAPVATSLWVGPSYTLVYNDAYRRILGVKHPAALGRSGADVWDELWPALEPQFAQVRAGGPAVFADEALLTMERLEGGAAEDAWFTYALSALTDDDATCLAVYNVAVETTARVLAERRQRALVAELEAARARLVDIVRIAPAFMAVLRGPDHVIELTNAGYDALVGGRDVRGRTVAEALPEAAAQGFVALLDGVIATGEPFVGREVPYRRPDANAVEDERYVDFVYQALTEADGTRSGVFVHGVDVTDQLRARHDVERLLGASEAARAELAAANAQLQDQQVELELASQQAQENAAELEMQAEELQATAAQLEERTEEAEEARQAAEDERARATAILEATADAYFVLDARFRIVTVNAAMERGSGLPREALLGRDFWTVFPGAVGTDFERHYRRAAAEGAEAHFTHDYSDGRLELVVEVDAYPAPGGGVVVFWRDVTSRVRAEAALRASEAKYRTAFASMDQGFCIFEMLFDAEGRPADYRFLETNPAFERQTGLVDAAGRTARELVPGLEAHWFDVYGRVATTGEPTRFENGSEPMGRWFDVFAFRIGRPEERRVALLFTDVSAAKAADRERERLLADSERARAEAEAARAEAEAANRAKAEFLATMSHELRTPLNAIGGYAELVALGIRGPVTPEQQSDLDRIQRSQRHLLGLINGVLNYARVEAGAVHYDLAAVPLDEVLATCEALTAPQVRAKGLALTYHGCTRDLAARADREKVQQIVLNLLTNAVKFTDPGGRLDMTCEGGGGVVTVRVRDTGRGIPPDQLERVFQPFVQVDAKLTRTQEGVGLGLAISRDLARGMGGDLAAESAPGAGSTFTLTLPVA